MENILSMLIFFPAAAAIVGFLIEKDSMRQFGIVVTVVEFVLSLLLWYHFDVNYAGMQFVQNLPLIRNYGINYLVGVDGVSLFLIIMITFMTMISLIGLTEKKNVKNLIITMLFLEMTMIGVFVSIDLILFYVFWEFTLIPMFYVVGFWGAEKRFYAAIKYFLYTFTGSLIMLVGILYYGYIYHETTGVWSFSTLDWNNLILPFDLQIWLFIAFFIAFAVKVPMVPFHTWLPLAHGQAPTIGSVMLAAVLLKMETYGFIRFSLPLFPDASAYFTGFMAILGLVAIIYTAMIAYAQEDMKQMIAYSSISHMGVIILGVYALNIEGIAGSVYLMIGHGIVSGALFMCVGVLYDRRKTKMIKEFGGLAHNMPIFALVYGIVLMASVGLPLTIGFIGEFLSLLGFYKYSPLLTFIGSLTIVLGVVYMLSMYKRTFFGKLVKPENKSMKDIFGRELFALGSLVILIIVLGIYPKVMLTPLNSTLNNLITVMDTKAVNEETRLRLRSANSIGEIK